MGSSSLQCGHRRRRTRALIGTAVCVVASVLAACSSTNSGTGPTGGPATPPVPPAAFKDFTGITPHSVTVANVSTETAGLFTGAVVGTEAYADYVNSTGGIHGRKLVVQSDNDQFAGAANKQLTEVAVQNDFALVGGFSLEDGFGGTVLAANPQVPNVTESLDPTTQKLPNTFSPAPAAQGWPLGPLAYFKSRFPTKIAETGTLVADLPSTVDAWNDERAAMEHLGYRVLYDPALSPSQTDFTSQVVSMKKLGVQILFLEQLPENYASAVVKDLTQQDFHPTLVLGSPAYSTVLVANSGGAAAIDGAYFEQSAAYYLGEDASAIPAVGTFNHWVQEASPGFHADTFTLYGWLSAELFAQALDQAGPDPSRGSVLQSLRRITAFSSGNLIPTSDPAHKVPISCYMIGEIVDGKFQRLDDPPIDGPTHGYRCDEPYYDASR